MKKKCLYVLLLVLAGTFYSCRNDKNNTSEELNNSKLTVEDSLNNIKIEQEKKARIAEANSVMAKLMATTETSIFASALVSNGMSDKLLKESGPFTVLAPTNDAIEGMDEESRAIFNNPELKNELTAFLNRHIIPQNLNSVTIVENIKKGNYVLTNLAGDEIKVTKDGSSIIFSSGSQLRAELGKSDIVGVNGYLHLINSVFQTK